jgi:hypothetical protein
MHGRRAGKYEGARHGVVTSGVGIAAAPNVCD